MCVPAPTYRRDGPVSSCLRPSGPRIVADIKAALLSDMFSRPLLHALHASLSNLRRRFLRATYRARSAAVKGYLYGSVRRAGARLESVSLSRAPPPRLMASGLADLGGIATAQPLAIIAGLAPVGSRGVHNSLLAEGSRACCLVPFARTPAEKLMV